MVSMDIEMMVMVHLKLVLLLKKMIQKVQVLLVNDSSEDVHLSKVSKRELIQAADRAFSKSKNKIKILELGMCFILSNFENDIYNHQMTVR